jgi:hypothetical protein
MWMNEWDIEETVSRLKYGGPRVQYIAALFLRAFKDEVNAHSDGWAYWRPAAHAAKKLMEFVQSKEPVSLEQYKKALTPIRSFYTRRGYAAGMKFPTVTGQEAA